MDDFLHDTLDISVSLGKVNVAELRGTLPVLCVGLNRAALAIRLIHRRLCDSKNRLWDAVRPSRLLTRKMPPAPFLCDLITRPMAAHSYKHSRHFVRGDTQRKRKRQNNMLHRSKFEGKYLPLHA